METHRLVLTGDLNQYGYLFGGKLLSWVDEAAFIAASKDFPHARFVTVGMGKVEFLQSIKNGATLRITAQQIEAGTTSVTYHVDICSINEPERGTLFSTQITFVNVDASGDKVPL